MRKTILALGAIALGLPGLASAQRVGDRVIPLQSLYDLDSASYIYCVTTGANNKVWGEWRSSPDLVHTDGGAGSNIDGKAAPEDAFAQVSVGDELQFNLAGVTEYRTVLNRSDDSASVNADIDLDNSYGNDGTGTGYHFNWRKLVCGTSATSGWVPLEAFGARTYMIHIDQMVATSIDAKLECEVVGGASSPITVWTKNYTAVAEDIVVIDGDQRYTRCRLGWKINTDDGDDLTTNAEQISVYFAGELR